MTSRVDWRHAWRRLRRDWQGKLGAVLAALVVWWVASSEPVTTAQRSLLVPLEVRGAEVDEVAVGVPPRVEVVITGPSDRMERLRATDVDAFLELADVDGDFERTIDTRVPQALEVVRVVPAEVIGRLEAVRRAEFAVEPRVALADDGRLLTGVTLDPPTVVVEARDPVLDRVASVVASVPADAADATTAVLVPIDAEGRPVDEARVVPETVRVTLAREARRVEVMRPISVASIDVPRVAVEAVEPTQVALVGPAPRLDGFEVVPGTVPDVTASLPPGRYDLPVRLELPEGVATADAVVATVRVAPPEPAPEADPANENAPEQ